MRLTLRTLLAWMDGVLAEDEQTQLGAKVSANAVAAQLAERIRIAVGRPGIGAPRPDGRGFAESANSVSEYLDNTLEPSRLEPFERICIESDLHLSEVAACHGLLAELSRNPSASEGLTAEDRQRLRQRVRGILAALHGRVAADEPSDAVDLRDDARAQVHAIREALERVPPSSANRVGADPATRSLRRAPVAAWAAAAVAAALLLALGGTLAWSLVKASKRQPVAEQRHAAERGEQTAADRRAESPEPPPVEERPQVQAAIADGGPLPPGADQAPAVRTPEEKAATVADTVAQTAGRPGERSPASGVGASEGDRAPPAAAPSAPDAPVSPAAPMIVGLPGVAGAVPAGGSAPDDGRPPAAGDEATQPLGFVGGEGVLLRLAKGSDSDWRVFPAGDLLERQEELLVPPALHADLHIRGVTVRLLPETRCSLTVDGDGVPRVAIAFGRIVVRASRPDATLGITAGGLVGRIEAGLSEPVAVQVELVREPGEDPSRTPPRIRSRMVPVSQGLAWRQTAADGAAAATPLAGIEARGLLDAGVVIEWSSSVPDRVEVLRDRPLPNWLESAGRLDRRERAAAEELAGRAEAATPLVQMLRKMADDTRVENRMLAAATLALLGEFDELVELLAAEAPGRKLEQRQWTQLEAATVPLALARGGNAAARLRQSFVDRGPQGKTDVLWAMARGVTDADVAAGADRVLVGALEDPELIVRRYAFQRLIDVTQPGAADRMRYRPDGLAEMRREGAQWWRGQLAKGLVRRGGAPPPTVERAE